MTSRDTGLDKEKIFVLLLAVYLLRFSISDYVCSLDRHLFIYIILTCAGRSIKHDLPADLKIIKNIPDLNEKKKKVLFSSYENIKNCSFKLYRTQRELNESKL